MLTRKIKLWDINAHITCRLCNGYLIDATTVTECLHTFCRSCLVKYLEENNTCPTCRIVIHQSHPLQYIGHDRTMQDIVYKLVPGLQEAEMRKQREFYHKLGMEVPGDIKGETCSAKQHLDSHRNGETKADESSNKETSEEKQEEDNDYHRSDEQVEYLSGKIHRSWSCDVGWEKTEKMAEIPPPLRVFSCHLWGRCAFYQSYQTIRGVAVLVWICKKQQSLLWHL
uniref:RING-type domain-containing protein n=1 Tax=Terrapene triunguis TaxID=2587831 RepID=A0A674K478_9SAUR